MIKSIFHAVLFLCTLSASDAQWLGYPAKNIPRLKDGMPDLNAPWGKSQDLSGTWHVPPSTLGPGGPPRYATYLAADLPADEVPLRPQARALIQERLTKLGKDIPFSRCLPAGVPMVAMFPAPFKIIQNAGLTVILYETGNSFRQIFTDSRNLPESPLPTWMGYSVGHWDGDTFVIESSGFNHKTWIDAIGHPHGEGLRITEKLHRRDFGHIDLAITIDDPEWYERAWTVSIVLELVPDDELIEDVCLENERDAVHMK